MNGWRQTTLGQVVSFQRGFDITRKVQREGSVPVVSSGGIGSFHNEAAAKGPGVVIGRKGTLGKVFYLNEDYWPHDTTLWVKDFKGSWPRFVYYFMTQLDTTWLDAGSANPTLNRNHLHPLIVWWAPVHEQRAIAEVLGALDDKIAANAKLASSITELLELEAQTEWLSVGDSSAILTDLIDLNPATKRPTEPEPVYVDMKKLPESGSGITDWEYREAKGGARFGNRDTLLARITPCLQNRKTGFVDFLEEGQSGIGSTEFIVLRSRPGLPQVLSYFVAVDPDFRDFAIRHMVGTSGRQRVSASDLASYSLPFPDPTWLADFGPRATRSFEFMKSLRGENRTLVETRDALLPQLMSGKIRVRDAEKLVEAVV